MGPRDRPEFRESRGKIPMTALLVSPFLPFFEPSNLVPLTRTYLFFRTFFEYVSLLVQKNRQETSKHWVKAVFPSEM